MTPSTQPIFEQPSDIACFSQKDPDIIYSISKESLQVFSLSKKSLLNKIDLNALFSKSPGKQFLLHSIVEAKAVNHILIAGDMIEKNWDGNQIPDDKSHFLAVAEINNGNFSSLQLFNELFPLAEYEDSEYIPAIYKFLDVLDINVTSCTQMDKIQIVSYENNKYSLCKFDNSLRLELNTISHSDNKMRGFIFFKEKLPEEPEDFVIKDFDDRFELKFPLSLMILSEDGFIYRYLFALFKEDVRKVSFLFNNQENLKKIEENKAKIRFFEDTFKIKEERKEESTTMMTQPKEESSRGGLFSSLDKKTNLGSSANILGSSSDKNTNFGIFSNQPTGGLLFGSLNNQTGISSSPNNGLFNANNKPPDKNEGIFGSFGISNAIDKKALFDLNILTSNKDNSGAGEQKDKKEGKEKEIKIEEFEKKEEKIEKIEKMQKIEKIEKK